MSQATEAMIEWFEQRAGAVTYSMNYRNGPSSYDCSSSVYYSMIYAGLWGGGIGNTESMFTDLPAIGWYEVAGDANGIPAQRGDVFIWGDPGSSAGAAGHTGIFVDSDNIVHCNYGYNSITVNNHDYIWLANGSPSCHIFRYSGNEPEAVEDVVQAVPTTTTTSTPINILEYIMSMDENTARKIIYEESKRGAIDAINVQEGKFRGLINVVMRNELPNYFHERCATAVRNVLEAKFPRVGITNGKPVGGSTSIKDEAAWNAANQAAGVSATNQVLAKLEALTKLVSGLGAKGDK